MPPTSEFILYAVSFRLAAIAAGLACVFMGYRLLLLGVMPRDGSEIDARSGEIRLTLKNASPGTCFALFGAFIIAIMVGVGMPGLQVAEKADQGGGSREIELRGDDQTVSELVEKGWALARAGNLDGAISAFGKSLSDPSLPLKSASEPLMGLASVYREQRRLDEAIAYARLVHQTNPYDANALVLIAQIEQDRGNFDQAVTAMQRAAELDPKLQPKLLELEQLQ